MSAMEGEESFIFSQPETARRVEQRGRKRRHTQVYVGPSQTVRQITRVPSRRGRNPYKAVHFFKRTHNQGVDIITSNISEFLDCYNFSLQDVPGYTDFSGLFDYYRITGIRVKVIPYLQSDSNSVGTTNNSGNPPIFYVVDTNDGSAPVSVNAVLEYNDHKIATVWKGFDVYFKPKFSDATQAERGGWVSTNNVTLDWYGLKIAIPPTVTATKFYVVTTFYIRCKDPK